MSTLAAPLAAPLYEGAGTSADVPGKYDCAINGRPFMFDTKYMTGSPPAMRRSSVPLLKLQQDASGVVSERSLNPEDLPRAAVESWHHGAGQTFYDRPDSDPNRFRSSKGVDPWTRGRLHLLKSTTQLASTSGTNLRLAPTSTRLYYLDGAAVKYDDDLSGTPSSMTGAPGGAWSSIATNGYDVWATTGSDLYHWVRGDTAIPAASSSDDVSLLVWVRGKGRLMGANGAEVYNITDHTVATFTDIGPSIISDDFAWVGFCDGPGCIYGAGYQGDKSLVFRWGIKSDGSGLDAAIPALIDGLPDGEIVRSIESYQGFVVLGTDDGVRFCTADDSGNITLGALIDLGSSVRCFEGQGEDIYFGWTDFDTTSTGLGRLRPRYITDEGAPAYASDLMASAQGTVLDVCTFLGRRVLAVSGSGVWIEHATDLVTEGSIDSGLITYGLPDDKVAVFLTVNHEALHGELEAQIAGDTDTFMSLGASGTEDSVSRTLNAGETRAEAFELRLIFTRDGSDATAGPCLTRATLESSLAPGRGEIFVVFLKIFDEWKDRNNNTIRYDTRAEYQALLDMEHSAAPVTYQDAGGSQTVFLDDHDFYMEKATSSFFDGTFAARLRRPRRRVT